MNGKPLVVRKHGSRLETNVKKYKITIWHLCSLTSCALKLKTHQILKLVTDHDLKLLKTDHDLKLLSTDHDLKLLTTDRSSVKTVHYRSWVET